MHWAAVSFDWNHIRAFLATVEEGNLSSAARALNLTQPTLGRQVAGLEEALGVTLFERTGRQLILTQAGLDLLEHVRDMGEAATRVSLSAAGQVQDVAGDVRISCSDAFSVYLLPPMIARLHAHAPDLTIEVIAENRVSDLMHREADIAIRHVRPEEPDLIARRLKDGRGGLYAAKSWIAQHGRPKRSADLAGHAMIGIDGSQRMIDEFAKRGLDISQMKFPIRSLDMNFAWQMVRQGVGLGVMSEHVAALFPEVERLALEDFQMIEFPVWLATHRELHTSRRIRVVFDFLADEIQKLG